ncbi:hypothetical protein [Clostridium cylindrosporum]|uniref:Uncharacterized protein n=1 Tax=Clostridium cylindrosporum DSM 605 TaxID=1121307 RepID=A0A0J8DBX3_CLOCY|nr:hypothetical protein [Clostridium cylindrosporum]KMT21804.1 hypothetical protein CLCY_3c00710 [Clostridium cylindrosporum DSM 605]
MEKSRLKFKIFIGIFIVGVIILLMSVGLGESEMSNVMVNTGGMETNVYLIYLEQLITKYRFLGTILSILGGLGILGVLDEFIDTFSKS